MFEPIDLIEKRMIHAREESDSVYFNELLIYGEFITKLITIQLVSALLNDKERTQYKYEHRLVRSNSIGSYSEVINEIAINYRDKLIRDFSLNELNQLNIKSGDGDWQYQAIKYLNELASNLNIKLQQLNLKANLRRWFSDFTIIRNKSKAHGAIQPSILAKNVEILENSIEKIRENYYGINQRSWVYLYQNLSGKYRVSAFTIDSTPFDYLKLSPDYKNLLSNGCYCYIDKPIKVNLLLSTPELVDFSVPNGNYRNNEYEIISYITGNRDRIKSDHYSTPVTELPKSKTEGKGQLEVQGESFGNLPPKPRIYVRRVQIEDELNRQLTNYYMSPIITLRGKGGIGKTTTALDSIHKISKKEHFQYIFWFSSRDIDLLLDGPRIVKANVFSIQDIADVYDGLLENNIKTKKERLKNLQEALSFKSDLGRALFIFDNFETIDDPLEVYNWLYQYIRPPNKILITSRESRDFKGDYPIEVGKMTDDECRKLIAIHSKEMGISEYLTENYIDKLISESDGHPYIIKILLGDVVRQKGIKSIERIVAGRDDILTALFRRTYSTLSHAATRVFLTLCSWRSMIPQIAIEAVLLRPEIEERISVLDAIEELRKCSLIDVYKSESDKSVFIGVPFAASIFGKDELQIFPDKLAVLEDRKLLQQFGVSQENEIKNGLLPKVERKFRAVLKEIENIESSQKDSDIVRKLSTDLLERNIPILNYLCTKFPEGYKFLSDLYDELGDEENAVDSTLRYIQNSASDTERRYAWRKLVSIHSKNNNWVGESHALSEICLIPNTHVSEISNITDRIIREITIRSNKDTEHKGLLFRKLAEIFDKRINESTHSKDYSRLAWLHIHIGNKDKALVYAKKGIEFYPDCTYCNRIIDMLES